MSLNALIVVLLSLTALGSESHLAWDYAKSSDYEVARYLLNRNYSPSVYSIINETGFSGGCEYKKLSVYGKDPHTGTTRAVQVGEYTPVDSDHSRTVIVLPPTGGENFLDRSYSRKMCQQHMARVLILQDWDFNQEIGVDLGSEDIFAIRTATAIRHLIEYTGEDDIAIWGTSRGAIYASLILGLDPRVKSAVLIAGGVGIPFIIAHSIETTLTKLRQQRFEKYGFRDNNEYQRALEQSILIRPQAFAEQMQGVNALQVIATQDFRVPSANQYLLNDFINKPETIEIEDDHIGAIKNAYFKPALRKRILAYLFQ